ncbi:acyltransferase family protein [Paraglaciecola arctica]|uniref:acyltransferase family protein n=1 Tax=Paraglaciecola arctica TaxID=1128911 RepID=UPI0002DFAA15|nr:acyltransferase [Paraglaciecola arctica]
MNNQLSIYLDLMRFIAALAVFASHATGFSGGWFWQFGGMGHEAVVFFFVLSGFVIAFVCIDKKETRSEYIVNRLARIYSVAFPAIILTITLYFAGAELNPAVFDKVGADNSNQILTILTAMTFLNQSWVAWPFFSNLPYWSLGYEVLYYVFLALFFSGKELKNTLYYF